jgi:hypothetical protein
MVSIPEPVTSSVTHKTLVASRKEQMTAALELIEEACDLGDSSCSDCSSAIRCDQRQEDDRRRTALYTSAILLQESAVGFYHPDVANTYHLLGWSFLHYGDSSENENENDNDNNNDNNNNDKGSLDKSAEMALASFLRAVRIYKKLFGSQHSSTIVVLDDLRDLVRDLVRQDIDKGHHPFQQQQQQQHLPASFFLEKDCEAIFDSWALQDRAEEALSKEGDEHYRLARELYNEALRTLPPDRSAKAAKVRNTGSLVLSPIARLEAAMILLRNHPPGL